MSGVALPRKQEEQADTDADGAVRDVEGGKTSDLAIATDDVEVQEIDDVLSAGQKAINEVADDAAKDEAERNLSAERVNVEVMAGKNAREMTIAVGDVREKVMEYIPCWLHRGYWPWGIRGDGN